MTTVISKIAYKAVWDSSNLAKGLMTTRQQFSEQKKILQSLSTPLQRYQLAQTNLATLLAKFPELQKHRLYLDQQIEKQHLQEEAAIRKLSATEKVRLWQLMTEEEKAQTRRLGQKRIEDQQRRQSEEKERAHQKRIQEIKWNSQVMEDQRRRSERDREQEHQKRIQQIKHNSQVMEDQRRRSERDREQEHQKRIQQIKHNSQVMEDQRRRSERDREQEHQKRIQQIKHNSQVMEDQLRRSERDREQEHQKRIQQIKYNSQVMEDQRRSAERQKERDHHRRIQEIRRNSEEMERARLDRMAARWDRARRSAQYTNPTSLRESMSSGPNWAGGGGPTAVTAAGAAMMARLGPMAAGAAGGYFSLQAANNFRENSVSAFKELERAQAAMTVFSGSLERSGAMIAQIRELSAQTGISFSGLASGTRQLLLRDIDPDKSLGILKQIAIVTGGNTDRMGEMALAMGQINQAGKLMGQELIQLVNAGWTPLEQISKKTGIAMADMRKEMEAGRLTADLVFAALDADVKPGGRFYGFLESLEGTTARAADRAAAAWEEAFSRVGQALSPVTELWNAFSRRLALDVSNAAGVFAGERTGVSPGGQQAAMSRAAARLEAQRKREAAAQSVINQQRAEQAQRSRFGLESMAYEQAKEGMTPEQLSRWERGLGLLSDFNQERAKLELAQRGTQADIAAYLDDATRKEFERLEAMRQQQSMLDSGLRDLDEEIAAQGKGAPEDTGRRSTELAANMRVGSQEAYKFMAGVQDRQQRERAVQHKQAMDKQQQVVGAVNAVKDAINNWEPMGVAG